VNTDNVNDNVNNSLDVNKTLPSVDSNDSSAAILSRLSSGFQVNSNNNNNNSPESGRVRQREDGKDEGNGEGNGEGQDRMNSNSGGVGEKSVESMMVFDGQDDADASIASRLLVSRYNTYKDRIVPG
jgi:hypothetical protein